MSSRLGVGNSLNRNKEVMMSPEEDKKVVKEEKKPAKAKATKEPRSMTKEEILAAVKSMTVMDLADLVKALEEEFGVSAAPVAVTAAAPAAAPTEATEEAPEEEKTEFTVILKAIGEKKIDVIKAVREVTDLGLKQAKDLVEAAPQAVRESISKEEAATVKQKLEAAGATIDIK
jgi:large subunit ribosomal protein L7/L12